MVNPVIEAIFAGCVTSYRPTRFTGGQPSHLVPTRCQRHDEPWPCREIAQARAEHRRQGLRERGRGL